MSSKRHIDDGPPFPFPRDAHDPLPSEDTLLRWYQQGKLKAPALSPFTLRYAEDDAYWLLFSGEPLVELSTSDHILAEIAQAIGADLDALREGKGDGHAD